jgi:flagellar FliL protein
MDERTESAEGGPSKASDKENGESGGGKGGNKFLMIGILAGVVLVNTIIAFALISATRPKDPEKETARAQADSLRAHSEKTTHMGATTAEEPIEAVVNIAGTNNQRFLKAVIILEFDDIEFPKLGEELAKRNPKFKDILIDQLSRMTLAELSEPDAKEKIRKELLRRINATLPPKEGEVREVFFTEYIIQ